jgi:hypothetical protein
LVWFDFSAWRGREEELIDGLNGFQFQYIKN